MRLHYIGKYVEVDGFTFLIKVRVEVENILYFKCIEDEEYDISLKFPTKERAYNFFYKVDKEIVLEYMDHVDSILLI